jgi:hypothetical protein
MSTFERNFNAFTNVSGDVIDIVGKAAMGDAGVYVAKEGVKALANININGTHLAYQGASRAYKAMSNAN